MLVTLGAVLLVIVSAFCSSLIRRYQACNKWHIFLYYRSHRRPVTDYKIHCHSFLITKPTRCTNFSNLFWKWNYIFRTVPLSIVRSYSLYTQQWYMSYRFVNSFRAGSGRNSVPSRSCCSKAVWRIPLLSVQWITPDDGQRNSPKHVEFHFKNKFEKLVHLVGFIIRKFSWCTVTRT
jgi:hypothetical protein